MGKTLKVIVAAILALTLMFAVAEPMTYAYDAAGGLNALEQKVAEDKTDTSKANEIGASIINWIWGISIVVAVVVLMITGLKFIVGSTQEKAEYKKSLIPLVIGALILVFAVTIVRVIFSFGK